MGCQEVSVVVHSARLCTNGQQFQTVIGQACKGQLQGNSPQIPRDM